MTDARPMPAAAVAGMGGEELRMRMEALGFDPQSLARVLGISAKTMRDMLTGRMQVPIGVAGEVLELADVADEAVSDLCAAHARGADRIPLYGDERAVAAAMPSLDGWPPRAWRAIVWRALQQLPDVRAVYAGPARQETNDA